MASGALTGHDALHGRVGKFRRAERASCGVADIARKRGGNMVSRFETVRCSTLAMAAGATAGFDGDMGKARAGPSGGTVARVAGFGSGHVIRWFTFRDVAIVALAALMRGYARVTEKSNTP